MAKKCPACGGKVERNYFAEDVNDNVSEWYECKNCGKKYPLSYFRKKKHPSKSTKDSKKNLKGLTQEEILTHSVNALNKLLVDKRIISTNELWSYFMESLNKGKKRLGIDRHCVICEEPATYIQHRKDSGKSSPFCTEHAKEYKPFKNNPYFYWQKLNEL